MTLETCIIWWALQYAIFYIARKTTGHYIPNISEIVFVSERKDELTGLKKAA
jgi:hypothetical protein